jgi:uncharacterized membrane protein
MLLAQRPTSLPKTIARREVMAARSGRVDLVLVVGLAHDWRLIIIILIVVVVLLVCFVVDVIGIARRHAKSGKYGRIDPEEADVVGCDGQGHDTASR